MSKEMNKWDEGKLWLDDERNRCVSGESMYVATLYVFSHIEWNYMLPLLLYGALMMTVDGRDQGKEKWPQRKLPFSPLFLSLCLLSAWHRVSLVSTIYFYYYISATDAGCVRSSWVFFFTKEKKERDELVYSLAIKIKILQLVGLPDRV
jgi:hypothetical protein